MVMPFLLSMVAGSLLANAGARLPQDQVTALTEKRRFTKAVALCRAQKAETPAAAPLLREACAHAEWALIFETKAHEQMRPADWIAFQTKWKPTSPAHDALERAARMTEPQKGSEWWEFAIHGERFTGTQAGRRSQERSDQISSSLAIQAEAILRSAEEETEQNAIQNVIDTAKLILPCPTQDDIITCPVIPIEGKVSVEWKGEPTATISARLVPWMNDSSVGDFSEHGKAPKNLAAALNIAIDSATVTQSVGHWKIELPCPLRLLPNTDWKGYAVIVSADDKDIVQLPFMVTSTWLEQPALVLQQ